MWKLGIETTAGLMLVATAAACSPREAPMPDAEPGPDAVVVEEAIPAPTASLATDVAMQCSPVERMPTEGRASPYDSATFTIRGAEAKVCYGRPSARGRTMIGGEAIPYGQLWRTGANEPTILQVPVAATIAGVPVGPGSYSLYTIPGAQEWTVIVNRSTSQWGHESQYTPEIQAQEVGRGTAPVERTDTPVEIFTIRPAASDDNAEDLLLEWEGTRVRIPVAAGAG